MQPGLSKEPNLSQSPEKVSKIEQKFIENQPCEENQRFKKIQFIWNLVHPLILGPLSDPTPKLQD